MVLGSVVWMVFGRLMFLMMILVMLFVVFEIFLVVLMMLRMGVSFFVFLGLWVVIIRFMCV